MYTGIQYFEAPLTTQEYEKLSNYAKQKLIRYSCVAVPSILLIGYGLFYFNELYGGKPEKQTIYQIIGGVGGLGEAILVWFYGNFIWNMNRDYRQKKKKIATGIVSGKRILNEGKFNESCLMLFQNNEFVVGKETWAKIEKGAKIELHVTLSGNQVLFIKRIG